MRHIKVNGAKLHSSLSRTPFYSITMFSLPPKNIQNRLNLSFPSEYSIDLISKNHIVVLKCSGRSIFIKNIPDMLTSGSLSDVEKSELHSFAWISLLDLNMDRQWRLLIRSHIDFWIKRFKNTAEQPAWSIYATSERLYNWIMQYNLISKTSDALFSTIFAESIVQQLKFLRRQMRLPLKLFEKTALIRAVVVGSAALNDHKKFELAIDELSVYLGEMDPLKSCQTTLEILKVLRTLIDIQAIVAFHKKNMPPEISEIMSKLAKIIRNIRHSDGGISIFQSEFTPSPTYIDAVLSHVRKNDQKETYSEYLRLQSFGGTTFIHLKNKYFPMEFSSGTQRIILGSYLYFLDQNLSFSREAKIDHKLHEEKNNVWFNGKSSFFINGRSTDFEKKLYINNLGTDLRGEELLSDESFSVTHHMILPSEISITPLEYQNGFFMDLKSGVRWMWNFSENTRFSFDFERNGILNGERKQFTLLTITTGSLHKNKLRWSLKLI
ncbi:MAG: hypothetical protein LBP41_02715 [Holosporaceae bacterium]|jgi:uncharacterized heparinase superfamily protein|nr:hypothetical protein [Holosporaceae bacterium]